MKFSFHLGFKGKKRLYVYNPFGAPFQIPRREQRYSQIHWHNILFILSHVDLVYQKFVCFFIHVNQKKKQVYIFFVFLILCFGCTYISFIQFVRLLSNFGVSLTTEINIACALADLITCTQAITSVNRTNSP
jgi:hypothetical protein